ncbi:MAG: hypothetical protein R3F22_05475 [Lysobacteraceae bacterium]
MRLMSFLLIFAGLGTAFASEPHDGHLFDQGHAMTSRSERADPALDHMKRLLGQWKVNVTRVAGDKTNTATGRAEISYMNRGYAYQEHRQVDSYDEAGNAENALGFLVYDPSGKQWGLGEGSSYDETIRIFNGDATPDGLLLRTASRRLGGMNITRERLRYRIESDDVFTVSVEHSSDASDEWKTIETRRYTRRPSRAGIAMPTGKDYGKPNTDRAKQSTEFDFLIGEWTANHQIKLQGNWIKFPASTTAVYVMDGYAILEHGWNDLDKNLTDAATSILRLYNRAERRWESLYLTNRRNSLLHFGGNQEGDEIVLHSFATHRNDPLQHYVFHDIKPDSYAWYGETSTDRGASFSKFWIIDIQRKPAGPE